jgi:hypothetical protein
MLDVVAHTSRHALSMREPWMFAQEKPPTDRLLGLIRDRMEPLIAAANGFQLVNISRCSSDSDDGRAERNRW